MNIKEAQDVFARINSEYTVYCDSDNNEEWFAANKTVGEIVGMIEGAEPIKTFAFQKGPSVYEAVYAQVFESEKIVLIHAKKRVVDYVANFYLVPLGKSIKIATLLPKANLEGRTDGMGGVSWGGRK